ncbi:excinuclease ABC subunit UvrC [Candidatus Azambacteria bacterium]|nr:excinuclease ABC subunit UvrC [Candidatus Azambacteria bacterium]
MTSLEKHIARAPKAPGVYFFKDKGGEVIYIGKASRIRDRLRSHFAADYRYPGKVQMIGETKTIEWIKTDSEIDALILEASLIKKNRPKYNVLFRDDKNYFFVGITKEEYPKVFITHQLRIKKQEFRIKKVEYVGPFTSGRALKETLRMLRKIFPFCTCRGKPHARACLNYELGRCAGICCIKPELHGQFATKRNDYLATITALKKIFTGKKRALLRELKRRMREASEKEEFEKAARLRDAIESLERIFAHSHLLVTEELERELAKPERSTALESVRIALGLSHPPHRIEAYDISNISGQLPTGSMVTFQNGSPDKNGYRMFGIKTVRGSNDIAMLKEVLRRRLKHAEWPYPDLFVIDGGRAQLNAGRSMLKRYKLPTPVIAIAKGAGKRYKRDEDIYLQGRREPLKIRSLPEEAKSLLEHLRDEAHRFAIMYHKKLRRKVITA